MALQHRPASSRAFDWLRSPTVPPPLAWGPDYVRDFFGKLFQNLEPLEVQETFAYLRGLVFPWSSACSGTDSPAWVFGGLRDFLAASGICTIFPHIVSAELDKQKRNFIQQVHAPRQLLRNIFDITREDAFNEISGRLEQPDSGRETRCWLIGFSCQTVSGLNSANAKGVASSCIQEAQGTTGVTFAGVLLVLQQRRPKLCILENVFGMMNHGQHQLVAKQVEATGYVCRIVALNPVDFGSPQSRPRLYFLCWREDLFAESQMSLAGLGTLVQKLDRDLRRSHSLMDLDAILAPESDEDVVKQKLSFLRRLERGETAGNARGAGARSGAQAGSAGKWVRQHLKNMEDSAWSMSQSFWRDELRTTFPEYVLLADRDKSLLDLEGIRFPDDRRLVVNTSQSTASALCNVCPTVTPHGRYWIAWRGRSLLGKEAMSLQNIYLEPAVARRFSGTFLQNLAGNAFSVTACAVAATISLCVLARMHRLAVLGSAVPAPAPAPAPAAKWRRLAQGSLDSLGLGQGRGSSSVARGSEEAGEAVSAKAASDNEPEELDWALLSKLP